MKTLRIISLIVLVGLFVVPAAHPAATQTKVIKIYESWPMQGSMIPEGKAMLNAAQMALDEVNGQVAGYKIELVFLDDASPTTGSWDGTIEATNGHPDNLKYAEDHADIIRRFARFPHRNRVLGRETTADEQAFLDAGGFSG